MKTKYSTHESESCDELKLNLKKPQRQQQQRRTDNMWLPEWIDSIFLANILLFIEVIRLILDTAINWWWRYKNSIGNKSQATKLSPIKHTHTQIAIQRSSVCVCMCKCHRTFYITWHDISFLNCHPRQLRNGHSFYLLNGPISINN